MKKTYKSKLILLSLTIILTLYLVNSNIIIEKILEYTDLYLKKLFPTSFIIYIISSLLINYQIIENLSIFVRKPTKLYIIIISLICGFPSGPKNINDLYKNNYISRTTANYLLTFSHFPNPLFVLGAVSEITSFKIAIKILISLYLSNFIIAILNNPKDQQNTLPSKTQKSFSEALNSAVTSSFKLQILIYGTNLFFYLMSVIITKYFTSSPLPFIFINGFFDLIKGIFSTTIITNQLLRSSLILFFLSLGSISLHIQIKSILSDTNLNYNSFLLGRLITTPIAIIIFYLIF